MYEAQISSDCLKNPQQAGLRPYLWLEGLIFNSGFTAPDVEQDWFGTLEKIFANIHHGRLLTETD